MYVCMNVLYICIEGRQGERWRDKGGRKICLSYTQLYKIISQAILFALLQPHEYNPLSKCYVNADRTR